MLILLNFGTIDVWWRDESPIRQCVGGGLGGCLCGGGGVVSGGFGVGGVISILWMGRWYRLSRRRRCLWHHHYLLLLLLDCSRR